MGVQLFTLENRIVTSGGAAAISELQGVEAAGIKTAAGLNGLTNSLDRNASAALNGTKGFRDLTPAYENQTRVLGQLTPATDEAGRKVEEHGTKASNANKKIQEHNETLHGLWGTLKQLAGAYFLFEGLHFIGEAVEQAAALHELSQKTGVMADTLSVLQFAGRRANVSVEQLGTAFKGMALSQGNLRDGVDKTVEAYARLGFTAESFKGLSPEQTFIQLAIAVGNVKDETERAEIAQRVFGRSGSMLIPLFEDLAVNGFAKTREEAEKFGAVITQDMADAADKAQDDWNDIVDIFKGMARSTIPLLADAVRALYEQLNMGPGGTWKNTLREMAQMVDLFTKVMTLGVAGTHFADRFKTGTSHGDPGGVRGDSLGMGSQATAPDLPAAFHRTPPTAAEIAAAKRERDERNRAILGLANMDESLRPADRLDFQGLGGPVGLKDRLDVSGSLRPGVTDRPGQRMMTTLKQDLFDGLQQLQPFAQGLQGFFSNLFATGKIGTSLKQFGQSILAGMGSIFAQMATKAIAAAPLFQAIGAAMRNPFTAGFALLAFGIALKALGASMGGTATGSGGDNGGSFANQTTNVTLLPNGAGGLQAPHQQAGPQINVLGANSPEGQRLFGEHAKAATRSRNM